MGTHFMSSFLSIDKSEEVTSKIFEDNLEDTIIILCDFYLFISLFSCRNKAQKLPNINSMKFIIQ